MGHPININLRDRTYINASPACLYNSMNSDVHLYIMYAIFECSHHTITSATEGGQKAWDHFIMVELTPSFITHYMAGQPNHCMCISAPTEAHLNKTCPKRERNQVWFRTHVLLKPCTKNSWDTHMVCFQIPDHTLLDTHSQTSPWQQHPPPPFPFIILTSNCMTFILPLHPVLKYSLPFQLLSNEAAQTPLLTKLLEVCLHTSWPSWMKPFMFQQNVTCNLSFLCLTSSFVNQPAYFVLPTIPSMVAGQGYSKWWPCTQVLPLVHNCENNAFHVGPQ